MTCRDSHPWDCQRPPQAQASGLSSSWASASASSQSRPNWSPNSRKASSALGVVLQELEDLLPESRGK